MEYQVNSISRTNKKADGTAFSPGSVRITMELEGEGKVSFFDNTGAYKHLDVGSLIEGAVSMNGKFKNFVPGGVVAGFATPAAAGAESPRSSDFENMVIKKLDQIIAMLQPVVSVKDPGQVKGDLPF